MELSDKDILAFWFNELTPKQWFNKDEKLDGEITRRFGLIQKRAAMGELKGWRKTPQGRLAEIIVLDQFSRNIFRDDARAFACDPLALKLAEEAIEAGADRELETIQKSFLYMPFMHSESKEAHEKAVKLFSIPGLEYNLDFERRHKAIIDRFGRYPHRNKVLSRISTPEEIEFLKTAGSSF